MNIKKHVSIFLGFVLFVLTPSCTGVSCNSSSDENFDNLKNIKFVSDEDIVVDSKAISELLEKGLANHITFISPNKNSGELLSKTLFPKGSPASKDVQQGQLGACSLLSVLSALADRQPELLKENLVEDGQDSVIVRLFHPIKGTPFYIKVRKTVPDLSKKLRFIYNDCLWVQMYLKAFAASGFGGISGDYYTYSKIEKNYKSLETCYPTLYMRMLTGKSTEIEEFSPELNSKNEKNLYKKIEKNLSDGGIAVCDFLLEPDKTKLSKDSVFYEGIIHRHAYTINRVYKDEEGQRWIELRNPWGRHVPKYCKNGKITVDTSDKTNGCFKLEFKDFFSQRVRIYFGNNEKIKRKSNNEMFSRQNRSLFSLFGYCAAIVAATIVLVQKSLA